MRVCHVYIHANCERRCLNANIHTDMHTCAGLCVVSTSRSRAPSRLKGMSTCQHVCLCVHVFVCVYIHTCMYVCKERLNARSIYEFMFPLCLVLVSVCPRTYSGVCVYLCACLHTRINTDTYIHTHTHTHSKRTDEEKVKDAEARVQMEMNATARYVCMHVWYMCMYACMYGMCACMNVCTVCVHVCMHGSTLMYKYVGHRSVCLLLCLPTLTHTHTHTTTGERCTRRTPAARYLMTSRWRWFVLTTGRMRAVTSSTAKVCVCVCVYVI